MKTCSSSCCCRASLCPESQRADECVCSACLLAARSIVHRTNNTRLSYTRMSHGGEPHDRELHLMCTAPSIALQPFGTWLFETVSSQSDNSLRCTTHCALAALASAPTVDRWVHQACNQSHRSIVRDFSVTNTPPQFPRAAAHTQTHTHTHTHIHTHTHTHHTPHTTHHTRTWQSADDAGAAEDEERDTITELPSRANAR